MVSDGPLAMRLLINFYWLVVDRINEASATRSVPGQHIEPLSSGRPQCLLNSWLVLSMASLCLLSAAPVNAQSMAVRINPTLERVDLSASTWLLEDPEGSLTLADVRSPSNASRFQSGSPRIGISVSAYWLRYQIRNESSEPLTRWLDSGSRRLQEIELFVPDENDIYKRQSASSTRPFADRPLPTASFVFPILFAANTSVDIYLRIRTTGFSNLEVAPKIWQPRAYQKKANAEEAQWLIYLGMAAALGLFNLLLYFSIRDFNYLLYVASLVSTVWVVSSTRGGFGSAFEYLWPNSPVFEQVAWIASVIPAFYFNLLFVRRFVHLRMSLPRLDSYLNICFLLIFALDAPLIILTSSQDPSVAWLMQRILIASNLVALALIIGGLCGVIYLAWWGNRSAMFITLAWSPYLLGAIYNVFTTAVGRTGAPWLFVWTSACELILMSLALADRFNQEKKAKVEAQEERAKAQLALVLGLQQSERELEGKVAQRTAEVKAQAAGLLDGTANWNNGYRIRLHRLIDSVG